MNIDLSTEDQAFQQEVRAFIRDRLPEESRRGLQRTTMMYAEPQFTTPWQKALQEKGWLVPLWPKAWGGTGWSALRRFIFENECALAGAPMVHPMGVRLVGPVILHFGTEAQKRHYLPRILSSEDYWCQGFSEPGAGSDLASLNLRARADGDDYILDGTKIWTSYAQHANRMFALVRTSSQGKRQEGITFLLLDMQSPGITVRPIRTIGGDHEVNEVHFDEVRVPQANRIGEENKGWACAKYLLEFERGAGIFSPRLRAQLRKVHRSVSTCVGDEAWTDALAQRLGEISADVDTFEWLELRSLGALEPGENPGPVSSVLKLRASRLKQAIGELGVDALGMEGLRWDLDDPGPSGDAATLAREYFNSRAYTIFGGAAEIQLGLIARTLAP